MINYKFYSRNQKYATHTKIRLEFVPCPDINISIAVFITNTICKVRTSKFPEDKSGIHYQRTNKLQYVKVMTANVVQIHISLQKVTMQL